MSVMKKVTAATWVFVALDHTGGEAEKARALVLDCGHTVYRRVCWSGRDPEKLPPPKRVRCEVCDGKPLKWRPAEEVEREHLRVLQERYASSG